LALYQFRIRKVISQKNGTLMNRTLPNKCTKLGAKIFRSYWVITVFELGHFLKLHPVDHWHELSAITRFPVAASTSGILRKLCKHLPNSPENYPVLLYMWSIYSKLALSQSLLFWCNWQRQAIDIKYVEEIQWKEQQKIL